MEKTIGRRIATALKLKSTTSYSRGRLINLFTADWRKVEQCSDLSNYNNSDVNEYIVTFIDKSQLYYCEGTIVLIKG